MISKIKNRMASEQGFTLIELLVVIVILGILVAIAVPSYLSFRSKAETSAAKSNVRTAIPAAQSYYTIGNTYVGLNNAALVAQAKGVPATVLAAGTATDFCIQATIGADNEFYDSAGAATITPGTCPAPYVVG